MNPYEVLGVAQNAAKADITKAHRRLSKEHHPDKGGDAAKFREVQEAYEILSDPERRQRYDATGKTKPPPFTRELIFDIIHNMMSRVIEAKDQFGRQNDPTTCDIREACLQALMIERKQIQDNLFDCQRRLERTVRVYERFRPKELADPVGRSLETHEQRLRDELKRHEDDMEISVELERVFNTYTYETTTGSQSEGRDQQPVVYRRQGGSVSMTWK